MEEDEDIEEFEDPNNYSGESENDLSLNQTILRQIRKCGDERSKEMIGGYYTQKETKNGVKDIYVPDQRAIYFGSITTLYTYLSYNQDDDLKKDYIKFKEKLVQIEEEAINSLKLALDYVTDARLKKELEFQIATKHVDADSFHAKKASDDKLEVFDEFC